MSPWQQQERLSYQYVCSFGLLLFQYLTAQPNYFEPIAYFKCYTEIRLNKMHYKTKKFISKV